MGMTVPLVLIIILGALWVTLGKPLQIHFNIHTIFPSLKNSQSWVSLIAIMTSYLGIEIATVHVKEVKDPETIFPKALFISVLIIVSTMLMGSLSLALTLPADKINLVGGVMQAFTNFFQVYHLEPLIPVITCMIIVGGLGLMMTWIISPAKGILQAAEDGYLPDFLTIKNKHNVPYRLMMIQAAMVSLACMAFFLMPSVNGSYWLLSDLSTQLYVLMYVLMFVAALILKKKFPGKDHTFQIPGKKAGTWLVCLVGFGGCLTTLIVGFIPPANIDVGGTKHYIMTFSAGMFLLTLPVCFFYFLKNKPSVTPGEG